MPFCTKCGAQIEAGSKFCGGCGEPVEQQQQATTQRVVPTQQRAEDLRGVTSAVRDYVAGATTEEKEKKYGQQQWGLFETDSQRRRGITTDQSLQEIEDFSTNGVTVQVSSSSSPSSSQAQGQQGSGANNNSSSQTVGANSGRFGAGSGSGAAGGRSSGSSGSASSRGGPGTAQFGPGTAQFGPGGASGANFFSSYQQRDAQKYKPGYRGQPP